MIPIFYHGIFSQHSFQKLGATGGGSSDVDRFSLLSHACAECVRRAHEVLLTRFFSGQLSEVNAFLSAKYHGLKASHRDARFMLAKELFTNT